MKRLILFTLLFFSFHAWGQTEMNVFISNGEVQQFNTSQIDSINFSMSENPVLMNIHLNSGEQIGISLNIIDSVKYITTASIELPQVITADVTEITSTTALTGGAILNDGGGVLSNTGICYATESNVSISDNVINAIPALGTFSITLEDLSPGTTYYLKAFAENEAGVAYGEEVVFTTLVELPSVETLPIAGISSNSALAGGNIINIGGGQLSNAGICYATESNVSISDNVINAIPASGTFSITLEDLSPATTYYLKAFAENEAGIAYGEEVSFTTLAVLPVVTTLPITEITSNTAMSGGQILNDGGSNITDKGLIWGMLETIDIDNNLGMASAGDGSDVFSLTIADLLPNQSYFVKAYAVNTIGVAYGETLSFTTLAALPEISIDSVFNITHLQASAAYNVMNDGGAEITSRGIIWGINAEISLTENLGFTEDGTGTGAFQSTILNLQAETNYFVRAYASNAAGTAYSNALTIETALAPFTFGDTTLIAVGGQILNENGQPISGVLITGGFGNETTTTDLNGVFFLDNIIGLEKFGYIKAEKEGYFKGSRSFIPIPEERTLVRIMLLEKTLSGTINSTAGGSVSEGNLTLNFPANAIKREDGSIYTGTVKVYSKALNPLADDMFDQMPGDLIGTMNDSIQILESFGMSNVELFDENNNMLQVADGNMVETIFTIPDEMLSSAPEAIEFWSFDEQAGIWQFESMAIKNDNVYTGEASHFSWWNVDIPSRFVQINGIVRNSDSSIVSNARIEFISASIVRGKTSTNNSGKFSSFIPINQNITIKIQTPCLSNSSYVDVLNDMVNLGNNSNLNFVIESQERIPIQGILVGCDSTAISQGYIIIGQNINFTRNGIFIVHGCNSGQYILRGFDSSGEIVKASGNIAFNLDNNGINLDTIKVCTDFLGSVTDIDGNTYQTVVIGNQEWMAENLRTTRYSDGSDIPYGHENNAWSSPYSIDVWCYWMNIPDSPNDSIRGKLYSWTAFSNPKNICPIGWHAPSLEEWLKLINFLGGVNVAGNTMKSTNPGTWLNPINNTNLSGFNAVPAGFRAYSNSYPYQQFNNSYTHSYHWTTSTSQFYSYEPYFVSLNGQNQLIHIDNLNKWYGLSVRCVKD
jgi:uncharacterized protein (TIGR02145 family)